MSRENGLRRTLLCAGMTGLIVFAWGILQSNGFFLLSADFNYQQIPFSAAAWEGVRSGSAWLWNMDLGASLITAFSFYNLGSPFFWITLFFSKDSFPWMASFLFILKYMTAAGTCHGYLRRFCSPLASSLGAMVYAFSGFQATNLMFFHFHDVVALFPLLLSGLEDYLREEKKTGLIFAVFINSMLNYFFFAQEVIFLAILFLFRVEKKDLRAVIKKGLGCLLCGLWGACMSGVLLVPSLLYIGGSWRSAFSLPDLFYPREELLHILQGMLLPADTMDRLSAIYPYDFCSTGGWLPLFGLSCGLAYVLRKRDWLGKLLMLLTLLSFFPLGNGLFLLFRAEYHRWWYMWTALLALATARVMDATEEYPLRKSLWGYLGILNLFALIMWFFARHPEMDVHIFDVPRFQLLWGIAAAGPVLLLILNKIPNPRRMPILLAAVCAFCTISTAHSLYTYRSHELTPDLVQAEYRAGLRLKAPDEQYRFLSSNNLMMMPGKTGGYGAFLSTAENESFHFSQLAAVYFPSHTDGEFRNLPYLPQLLGCKYEILENEGSETARMEAESQGKTVVDSFSVGKFSFCVTEEEACPIGFAADRWITEEDLISLPLEQRAVALMNAFPVGKRDTARLVDEGTAQQATAAEVAALDPTESIQRTVRDAVEDFHRDGHGFSCRTAWIRDRYAYFTVPCNTGWRATVDGTETEILNAGGMMALRVPAGTHRVRFTFHTPGLASGILLSAISLLAFGMYLLRQRKIALKSDEQ